MKDWIETTNNYLMQQEKICRKNDSIDLRLYE